MTASQVLAEMRILISLIIVDVGKITWVSILSSPSLITCDSAIRLSSLMVQDLMHEVINQSNVPISSPNQLP